MTAPNVERPGGPDPFEVEPLRVLVGPTASGKTELALELAERAGAEILSLDSMLVYRGMDLGTAKPGRAERERVRHHLLDLVEPHESFSVQRWLAEARAALADVQRRGRRALFVGGTGLYLKTLAFGMFDGPPVDPALRGELESRWREQGGAALHAALARVDAASAARIHANDRKRVLRALEVWEQSGRPLSDWQREWNDPARGGRPRRIAGLELETVELDRRIAARTREMLDRGWAEEALRIRDAGGLGPTARQALGYADAIELAEGRIDRPECERRVALATRQFARRQRTWLRKFPEIAWSRPSSKNPAELLGGVLGWFGW